MYNYIKNKVLNIYLRIKRYIFKAMHTQEYIRDHAKFVKDYTVFMEKVLGEQGQSFKGRFKSGSILYNAIPKKDLFHPDFVEYIRKKHKIQK